MSQVFDDAEASVLAGLEAEQDGQPLHAIERLRQAIDALAEDRELGGARVPHILLEARASGHLLRVLQLYGDDEDEVRAVAVATLDRWDLAMRVDREDTSSPTFVDTMVNIGRIALRTGDLDLARRLHDRAAVVVAQRAELWFAADPGDPLAPRGPSAVISLAMFDAAVLDAEGRPDEAVEVLRDAIGVVDSLGGYPTSGQRTSEAPAGESLLVGRFLRQAVEVGRDPSELAPFHDRHVELLGSAFNAYLDEGDETRAAMTVHMLVGALGRAPACGRSGVMPALAARIQAAVEAWAQTDSVIARMLAGDLPAALAELGAGPDDGVVRG